MPKELNTKQQLLSSMLEESLTRSEFEEIATMLAEHAKKIDQRSVSELEGMSRTLKSLSESVKIKTEEDFNALKNKLVLELDQKINSLIASIEQKSSQIDKKLSTVKNGKDADNEEILKKLLEAIKIPTIEELKDDLPVMGEEVRDSLELLKEDDRLDVSAIKGIKKLILSLMPKNNNLGGVQLNTLSLGIETPVGTKNGTNKEFTVTFKPEYITYNGQLLYEDSGYAYTANKITLDNAPQSTTVLKSHYKNI